MIQETHYDPMRVDACLNKLLDINYNLVMTEYEIENFNNYTEELNINSGSSETMVVN